MRLIPIIILLMGLTGLQAAHIRIELRETVSVLSDSVTMGAVADLHGNQNVVDQLKTMTVRRLDGIGTWTVDAALIHGLTRPFRPAHQFTITGRCLVTRQARVFTTDELVQEARAFLLANREGREVEAEVLRPPRILTVPGFADDKTKVEVEPLTADWWGEVPMRLKVMRGERELARTLVIFRVEAYKVVVVAERHLPPGHIIGLQDCRLERVLLSSRVDKSPTSVTEVLGWMTRRQHQAGTPITPNSAQPPPDVHSGQNVVLNYVGPTFTLSTHATAMGTGIRGETIRARTQAGTIIDATVVGPNEITVLTP